jgi:beta-lactamase class A
MTTDQALSRRIAFEQAMAGFEATTGGRLGVMVRDLAIGDELRWRAEDPFPTASTLKVPLLYALYRLAQEGELDLAARVELRREDRVPGSGVLRHLDAGLRPTVRDLAELMIIVSDNYATDLVYQLVGRERLARVVAELGLAATHLPHTTWELLAHVGGLDLADPTLTYDTLLERLDASGTVDPEAPYVDDEYDRSTPADMVRLLALIDAGHGLEPESRTGILDILRHQTINDRIPAKLPDNAGIEVAHKTGSVRGVRNDIGIVTAPGVRYAIAIMSRGLPDPVAATPTLADLSRWVWDRLACDTATGCRLADTDIG